MAELTVTALRVAQAVVGTGSFTAAADMLGYTQSAISRQVAAAEAAAGTPLFVRGPRGVEPTPAGAAVARRAASALSEIDAVARDLAELTDQLAGRVVLGAFPTAMWTLAPRTVADLRRRHPALAVELREGSTPVLLRQLRSGRVDVAVIALGPDLPAYELDGLRTSRLPQSDLLVALPRDHRLADRGQVPVTELAGEDWVAGTGLRGDPQFGPWPTLPNPRIAHTAREWPARLGLVTAGLGITVVPSIAADGLPAGIVTIRIDDPSWLGRTAVAATREERGAVIDVVVATLRHVALSLR
ncbi:LysR family transcriptional regulator [Phytoactinopolyspora halotolerans]|uniref:LysR family transcriptional regulator n=2 Tax=Phytoactinopolyspora halotolerans TaxID=1981512 RepID=A0A6L9S7X6_9ACTN|nr:LysR family transcriptional regulator [Phytoactinopolyspora halotolerans]